MTFNGVIGPYAALAGVRTKVMRALCPLARLRGAFLASLLLALAGCASGQRKDHPIYWDESAAPLGFPETVRAVNEDRFSFAKNAARLLPRVSEASEGRPISILALSGGGAGAAFGAGALVGLSKGGNRPTYQIVTGVSAGALTAPFAFLGPDWDKQLTDAFSGKQSGGLVHLSLKGLLFGPSLLSGKPLANWVNHYATQDMLDAVAQESAKGRLLLIATTDLDSERTVIWDIGAIARQGGAARLRLFRQVLIASASIPGVFPPVMVQVDVSGTVLEEMHVDGSTTASVFIAPEIAYLFPEQVRLLLGANIYLLANGQYSAATATTSHSVEAIMKRGIQSTLQGGTRSAIIATLMFAATKRSAQASLTLPGSATSCPRPK